MGDDSASQYFQDVLLFLCKQLRGLADPKSPYFSKYFYVLEVCFDVTSRHSRLFSSLSLSVAVILSLCVTVLTIAESDGDA